jgi:sugar phosphate isomerase/epimerase
MLLCFDATRFGTGLDGAIELASAKGLPALEYSFAPFSTSAKGKESLAAGEKKFLKGVRKLSEEAGVLLSCLGLDFCLFPMDKKSAKSFHSMVTKLAQVANAVNCKKIAVYLAAGENGTWLEAIESELTRLKKTLAENDVGLLLRLATAPEFRGKSLKSWKAMEPQDWRNLLSVVPGLGLSFSPADCVWLGIDYLKILSGVASGIEHIEAHDIEINRPLLNDSGMYGPLWWRYRLPGKGQVDWTQLVEALKLYDFKGSFSIHLDDEFVADDAQSLEEALESSVKLLAPIVND